MQRICNTQHRDMEMGHAEGDMQKDMQYEERGSGEIYGIRWSFV
jgi:hypothetical protein